MSKIKQIKRLDELITLEKEKEHPDRQLMIQCVSKIKEIEDQIVLENKRIEIYLKEIRANKKKREEAYANRKLIKLGERESYRQRKIRLNRERRQKVA